MKWTTLDRIDEIVTPGVDLVDCSWTPPALTDARLRRRPTTGRAAGERATGERAAGE